MLALSTAPAKGRLTDGSNGRPDHQSVLNRATAANTGSYHSSARRSLRSAPRPATSGARAATWPTGLAARPLAAGIRPP